jgi:hypothetical protein
VRTIYGVDVCNGHRKWYSFSWFGCFIVINATFNNISVISWRSVLLVEETGIPGENHRHVASRWQTLSHNVVSSAPRHERIRTHNFSSIRVEHIKIYNLLTSKIIDNYGLLLCQSLNVCYEYLQTGVTTVGRVVQIVVTCWLTWVWTGHLLRFVCVWY